jgi:hypothetical protein
MHERAIGDSFAQPEIRKEIVSRQTLKVFAQRGSQRRFFRRAFTVGEAQRAFLSRICTDQTLGTGFNHEASSI